MFNSTILDVAIGIIFVYLLLSLICSAASEMIELLLKKRATDLERGIRELLKPGSASGTNDIVQDLYNHPLINGLFDGQYETSGIARVWRYLKGTDLPSYIPARNFALALLDVILPGTTAGTQSGATGATAGISTPTAPVANQLVQLRTALNKANIPSQVQQALVTLIDAAGDDVARTRANIEEWFNSSMDRVSGWYKRRSQVILLVLGFLIAVAVNADSILIVRKLASDRALRESVVAAAEAYARANATSSPSPSPAQSPSASTSPSSASPSQPSSPVTTSTADGCLKNECKDPDSPQCKLAKAQCELKGLGLPIGWSSTTDQKLNWYGGTFSQQIEWHLLGWILTALAISLGAPFWFDLLNKFIVVRSTVKPKEKSPEEKSKD
jgi:hypothetical protein